MDPIASQILLALTWLEIKHLAADYFLQTPYQYLNKGRYGHPGGLVHAGIHAGLTMPVFLFLPAQTGLAIAVLAGEFMVHYHVDWSKENLGKSLNLTPGMGGFWRLFGVDQFAHQITYLGIVWALLAL